VRAPGRPKPSRITAAHIDDSRRDGPGVRRRHLILRMSLRVAQLEEAAAADYNAHWHWHRRHPPALLQLRRLPRPPCSPAATDRPHLFPRSPAAPPPSLPGLSTPRHRTSPKAFPLVHTGASLPADPRPPSHPAPLQDASPRCSLADIGHSQVVPSRPQVSALAQSASRTIRGLGRTCQECAWRSYVLEALWAKAELGKDETGPLWQVADVGPGSTGACVRRGAGMGWRAGSAGEGRTGVHEGNASARFCGGRVTGPGGSGEAAAGRRERGGAGCCGAASMVGEGDDEVEGRRGGCRRCSASARCSQCRGLFKLCHSQAHPQY